MYEAWPNFAGHVVGKSAMLALSRQLALDLAPQIRVNAVAPGPVLPPVRYTPEKIERTAKKALLGHWGTPDDVSQAVLYLVQADYVTGDVLVVDGGERLGHRKHEEG
ncbi:MAG: SDR family oxidoreductase [Anaerolineaceae bacterium]|nr:SDR family oxidoreductase [Anaerolineaceae bacterium]